MRVCMFVYNRCTTDARVLKEARTLAAAGHEVAVVAVLDATTAPRESRDGFAIVRIDRRPLHYRLLWRVRAAKRRLRIGRARARRAVRRTLRLVRRTLSPWRRLRRSFAGRRAAYLLKRLLRGPAVQTEPAAPEPPRAKRPPVWARLRPLAALALPVALPLRVGLPVIAWLYRSGERTTYRSLMSVHKPLMYLDFYARAYRMVRTSPPDAYHAHDLNTLPVAAALARRTGRRLVYDAHELFPEISTLSSRERRVWLEVERRLVHQADEVVTVCDSIAEELARRHHIPPPTVLLNCPPARGDGGVAAGPLRELAGVGADEPIVLYQGGFARHRGLETLVRAAGTLQRRAVLVLMGWGALEDELRRFVAAEGLDERVRFVPPVPQGEVITYAAAADVGVIPYEPVGLNNTYTTPNKLFDYMTAGLPIVGSRLPELVRFIEANEIGLTFPPGDAAALAAALDAILGDAVVRERMRAGALRAAPRYTWEAESRKLLAIHGEQPLG